MAIATEASDGGLGPISPSHGALGAGTLGWLFSRASRVERWAAH